MTPWQRIMRAAKRGTGLRLSPDDALRLSRDDAIETRAALDDERDEEGGETRKCCGTWPDEQHLPDCPAA